MCVILLEGKRGAGLFVGFDLKSRVLAGKGTVGGAFFPSREHAIRYDFQEESVGEFEKLGVQDR